MTIKIIFDHVENLTTDVFTTSIDPEELGKISRPQNEIGGISILLINENYEYSLNNKILTIDSKSLILLNKGKTEKALLISNYDEDSDKYSQDENKNYGNRPNEINKMGDPDFIGDLPSELKLLGENMLTRVRENISPSGYLQYYPISKRYVEQPDNFWAVKIQPRKKDLVIFVRGDPDRFAEFITNLEIKRDRTGYSSFHISKLSEGEEAIDIIHNSVRKQ